MDKVIFVRLLTGEELIGVNVGFGNGEVLRIKNPAQITISASPKGPQVGLIPFVPYASFDQNTVEFNRAHVMFTAIPDPRMEENYRKANNMVITGAGKGLLLP